MAKHEQKTQRLSHEEYVDERKELYKYQQACYDSFERILTALAGAFLAFSVAFLGFLNTQRKPGGPVVAAGSAWLLVGSWIAFGVSLASLVLVFFANARGFTVEIIKLEDALENQVAMERSNIWRYISLSIYALAAIAFLAGLAFLLLFSQRNFTS